MHPPYATAFSIRSEPLPLVIIQAQLTFKNVRCAECFLPGSKELCGCFTDWIERNPDIKDLLMKQYGILNLGADFMNAYYQANLLEDTAKVAYLASNIQ